MILTDEHKGEWLAWFDSYHAARERGDAALPTAPGPQRGGNPGQALEWAYHGGYIAHTMPTHPATLTDKGRAELARLRGSQKP